MIDKGETLMIDKGDNFDGAVVAPTYWTIILVSAIVSLAVSLATVMGTLWFVSGSPWEATEPATVKMVTPAPVPLPRPTEAVKAGPGEMIQRGDVRAPLASQEEEVYYAVPFASPPNLRVTSVNGPGPKFTEQRKDGFKYKFLGSTANNFTWEARGLKAGIR